MMGTKTVKNKINKQTKTIRDLKTRNAAIQKNSTGGRGASSTIKQ